MLEEVLGYINNWFECGEHEGQFVVTNNGMDLPFLQDKQYFRVKGSVFNDGLHQYPATDMVDEEFSGVITTLAVPQSVIQLSEDINDWKDKYGEAVLSPYQSESFGGYSYSKSGGYSRDGGDSSNGWQSAFRDRLKRWKKI